MRRERRGRGANWPRSRHATCYLAVHDIERAGSLTSDSTFDSSARVQHASLLPVAPSLQQTENGLSCQCKGRDAPVGCHDLCRCRRLIQSATAKAMRAVPCHCSIARRLNAERVSDDDLTSRMELQRDVIVQPMSATPVTHDELC